jgi:predicted DNA-binding transcriptional regulator AlpA
MAARTNPKPTSSDAALANFDQLPDSAFVPQSTLEALLQTSGTTVWRWSRDGKLPKPRKLGGNTTRWNVGELRQATAKMAG